MGIVFDIVHSSFVDGPGIRTTVFFKGCNLSCAWCHNPESQRMQPERLVYADRCIGCGRCKTVCPSPARCTLCGACEEHCPQDAISICGKEWTEAEVMTEILRDRRYYGKTGGVTFSGGECMLQPAFLLSLLQKCKEAGIRTAVDTAGNVPPEHLLAAAPYTDLFLYDVKCFDAALHQRYTGCGNRLILDNYRLLRQRGAEIIVRIPIIPGVNDTAAEMEQIKAFLLASGFPEKVELLPYHKMGDGKYAAMGREVPQYAPPDAAKMKELSSVFAGLF